MMSKKALYIGHIGSEGTAMAIHSRNIAQVLEMHGFQVSFVCQCVSKGKREYGKEDKYEYLYTKQYIKVPKLNAIEWMLEELSGIKLFHLFKKKMRQIKPDLVMFYGYSAEKKIVDYCKKNNVEIIVDRTDWFEKSDRKGLFGRIFTKYVADKSIEKYDYEANGVISISKYFYDFYKAGGQNTIWIPPVFEVAHHDKFERNNSAVIRLVYAGSLGGTKDIIDPVVECVLSRFNKEKIRFELNLVGITEEQLNAKFGKHDWNAVGINANGHVPHDEAERIVSESDFSFLLRQNKRYAKAGFSTKFAESMSNGVPVICTKVGGADVLVDNMRNGILIENNEVSTIEATLNKLLNLTDDEIVDMKNAAYESALQYFDYHSYIESLRLFIENNRK